MTYLLKDIADHLGTSQNIADAFGDKIYAGNAPQGHTLEQWIIINDISVDPEYSLRGEVGTHTSIMQIDVWTDGRGGAKRANDLGEYVRNRLSGYRGTFGTGAYGTSRMIRKNTLASQPQDGSDAFKRRVSMDFEIIHTADVPSLT